MDNLGGLEPAEPVHRSLLGEFETCSQPEKDNDEKPLASLLANLTAPKQAPHEQPSPVQAPDAQAEAATPGQAPDAQAEATIGGDKKKRKVTEEQHARRVEEQKAKKAARDAAKENKAKEAAERKAAKQQEKDAKQQARQRAKDTTGVQPVAAEVPPAAVPPASPCRPTAKAGTPRKSPRKFMPLRSPKAKKVRKGGKQLIAVKAKLVEMKADKKNLEAKTKDMAKEAKRMAKELEAERTKFRKFRSRNPKNDWSKEYNDLNDMAPGPEKTNLQLEIVSRFASPTRRKCIEIHRVWKGLNIRSDLEARVTGFARDASTLRPRNRLATLGLRMQVEGCPG